jgi:hypothetical protein
MFSCLGLITGADLGAEVALLSAEEAFSVLWL